MTNCNSYTMLDKPQKFNELFYCEDLIIVQLFHKEAGFCGAFSWMNNTIQPFDYGLFSDNMIVYGFRWTKNGVDILI